MEYFTQFVRILGVTLAGEILHLVLPLPIPASVYGLALMLAALLTGVLKLEQVEGAAGFLVQVMPVTFIPAVGGIVGLFDQAKSFLVALVLIPVLSLFAVLGVTGRVTQAVIRREARRNVK